MVFNAILMMFQLPILRQPVHLEFFLQMLHTIFFPSHWQLSNITIVETMDIGGRGMNPVTMTVINPLKEYLLSLELNQQPPILNS